jgi:hypothetical protein
VKGLRYYIVLCVISSLFAACSSTRHLPPGEKLYTGAAIDINNTATVLERKVLTEDLAGLTRPKPNTKFLGMRIKLWIHNLFRNKKENSFFGRIRDY